MKEKQASTDEEGGREGRRGKEGEGGGRRGRSSRARERVSVGESVGAFDGMAGWVFRSHPM